MCEEEIIVIPQNAIFIIRKTRIPSVCYDEVGDDKGKDGQKIRLSNVGYYSIGEYYMLAVKCK